ncbi:MAG: hypothetical protein LUG93_15625 [Lachnospiraceae bacterium]|nr:hypothetical protein [Lachnospiraceae bacterium]
MSDRYENDSQQYGDMFKVTPSRSYHKYWQGYTETQITTPKGKKKIKRTYVAPWKQQDLTDRQWKSVKVIYSLLTLLSVFLTVYALSRRVGSNVCWYVALAGLPSVILLFLQFSVTILYDISPRKMTLWEHRSSSNRIRYTSLISGIALSLTALATLIYTFINQSDQPGAEFLCAVLLLLAAFSMFAIRCMESRIKYIDIPNDVSAAEDSYAIR